MALLKKKQPSSCSAGCIVLRWIVAALLFVAAVFAAVGIVETHVIVDPTGSFRALQFGSTPGSLSIIAFCIAAVTWMKQMKGCCKGCREMCAVR